MEIENNIEIFPDEFSNERFKSRDLYLAAYLMATDHDFIEASIDNERRYFIFEFADKDACDQEEKLYTRGKTSVETLSFVESIKYLKKIVKQ